MTHGLVTVYITTRNRLNLLKRALYSVLNQTYSNIEIIVVDDYSNDGTVEFLNKIAAAEDRVRILLNESNLGACESRNRAIFSAKGDFITGLDDDDYYLPDRIRFFVDEWKSKKRNCIALFSNNYVKESGAKLKKSHRPSVVRSQDLFSSNYIGNQIFTRTEILVSANGFDHDFQAWQDLEFWYRLLFQNKAVACLVREPSYVVDVSHPHERISSSKLEKIKKSLDIFSEKHGIGKNEYNVLAIQYCLYKNDYCNFIDALNRFVYYPSILNFKFFIQNTYKIMRSIITG